MPDPDILFKDLDLSPEMLTALRRAGYERPTPVQAGVIPPALEDIDVVGQARTGTGKTAAYVIPILEQIAPADEIPGVQAMVLVPTRELAVQVREEFVKLAHGTAFECVALYGGKPIKGQIDKLRRRPGIVVGTPGRILDHLSRRTLSLAELWCIVLDEADRMLDIGFRPDIGKILRQCPTADRQTLLLSATIPPPIERIARRYMREPQFLNFSPAELSSDTIDQFYFTVEQTGKFDLLLKLLERESPRQAIIFCRTKRRTDQVASRLLKVLGSEAGAIHGDLSQPQRDRTMADFRAGRLRYLIATDIVGRGIDVSNISHIINYDTPAFCDDYVHRVGRTGRMGREGVAYTFVTPEEGPELTKIETRINQLLTRDEIAGFSSVGPRPPDGYIGIEPDKKEAIDRLRGRYKKYSRRL